MQHRQLFRLLSMVAMFSVIQSVRFPTRPSAGVMKRLRRLVPLPISSLLAVVRNKKNDGHSSRTKCFPAWRSVWLTSNTLHANRRNAHGYSYSHNNVRPYLTDFLSTLRAIRETCAGRILFGTVSKGSVS